MPSIKEISVTATKIMKSAMTVVSLATDAPTTASRSPMATSASDGEQLALPSAAMATLKAPLTPSLESLSMNSMLVAFSVKSVISELTMLP